ncbi:hypothetical protein HSEST_0857 [Halapricum desulfuricans]|uniref:Uncharacterized protein n=1 Tax=Halapricum desulfuricans TaxID=2841257 RepID=A0A897NUK9_9EURY|nr:hypothetical protein HSEST_0857 [Halapricum desulfuricans]
MDSAFAPTAGAIGAELLFAPTVNDIKSDATSATATIPITEDIDGFRRCWYSGAGLRHGTLPNRYV